MSKETFDCLLFHANDKANQATSMMQTAKSQKRRDYYHGQYMAFCEMYTLITNMKEREK